MFLLPLGKGPDEGLQNGCAPFAACFAPSWQNVQKKSNHYRCATLHLESQPYSHDMEGRRRDAFIRVPA